MPQYQKEKRKTEKREDTDAFLIISLKMLLQPIPPSRSCCPGWAGKHQSGVGELEATGASGLPPLPCISVTDIPSVGSTASTIFVWKSLALLSRGHSLIAFSFKSSFFQENGSLRTRKSGNERIERKTWLDGGTMTQKWRQGEIPTCLLRLWIITERISVNVRLPFVLQQHGNISCM